MRFKRKICWSILFSVVFVHFAYSQNNYATNIRTTFSDEKKMFINYDIVSDDEESSFHVVLEFFYQGELIKPNPDNLFGDYGHVNSPGNKIIYWNYEGDFNQDIEDLEVNVFVFREAEPEAKFTLNTGSGDFYAPCKVDFTNLSENSDRFEWNFGDPGSGNKNTSAVKNPTHIYESSGRYVVTLTAHDERLEQEHTFRDTLFVEEKLMGGVKLFVIGGLNFSDMLMDEGELDPETQGLTGFHVGPAAEFPITEWVSFETGLLLSTKGAVYKTTMVGVNKSEFNLLYLDVPLTAKARYDFGGAEIFGTAGPYVGMGLSGKMKQQIIGSAELIDSEKDVSWDSDLKRLDYGLTIGAGVEVNAIRIGISYQLGFANISAFPQVEDHFIYNRVFRISAGYRIVGE